MAGSYRKYNEEKDQKAAHRIWIECGWIEDEKKERANLDRFIGIGSAWVYAMSGVAEALTLSHPATYHHNGTPLSLAAIVAVTTSRVARNQGAASGTLARSLEEAGRSGIALAGLSCFEQGFYDRLGFGTGSYISTIQFDPSWLKPMGRPATPVRLSKSDWKAIHSGLIHRRKYHGAIDMESPEFMRVVLEEGKHVFGLGYKERGKLTHFFIAGTENVEEGPYGIRRIVYRNMDQLREVLALIKGLGDQVRVVRMHEPAGVQMQSLLRKPFQLQDLTHGSSNPSRVVTNAYSQMRILDVPTCIRALATKDKLEFNLSIHDPLADHLPLGAKWNGAGGDYSVSLGPRTSCSPGHRAGLPSLSCTINDLTRFWEGAVRAEVLAGFASFQAPATLISDLDEVVQLPVPVRDWDY